MLAYVAGSGRLLRNEYQGDVKPRFRLAFDVEGEEKRPNGTPYQIRSFFGASIQPRSNLGKLIATARGRELAESEMGTMDEAPAAGVEEALPQPVETMLAGVRVMAMVKHTEKGWADFHVDSATKAPAQAASEGW